jgi:hypothetical protein
MKQDKYNFIPICKSLGIEEPTLEYMPITGRKWRIDYSWPFIQLAVEIEGAVWVQGRHTRGSGFMKDLEKYNRMAEERWTLLRYEPNHIDWDQIERIYKTDKKLIEATEMIKELCI